MRQKIRFFGDEIVVDDDEVLLPLKRVVSDYQLPIQVGWLEEALRPDVGDDQPLPLNPMKSCQIGVTVHYYYPQVGVKDDRPWNAVEERER